MKRTLLVLALAAVAVPLFASDSYKLIARVNGREITNADLDAQWERVPAKLQAEYLKNGGKAAFLDNYISKKLMVMDAVSSGFAKKIGVSDEKISHPSSRNALRSRRSAVTPPTR